jgi:hypothetical protein
MLLLFSEREAAYPFADTEDKINKLILCACKSGRTSVRFRTTLELREAVRHNIVGYSIGDTNRNHPPGITLTLSWPPY